MRSNSEEQRLLQDSGGELKGTTASNSRHVSRRFTVALMLVVLASSAATSQARTPRGGIADAGWLLWHHASTAEKKIVIAATVAGMQDTWYDAEDQEQTYILNVLIAQNDTDRLSGVSRMRLMAPPPSNLPTYSKPMQYYISALNRIYRVRQNRSYYIAALLLCFSDKPARICKETPAGLRFVSK
jgi:hypothetical protein